MTQLRNLASLLLLPAWLLLAACGPIGDPSQPIPTALVPAPGKAERLVVILPGRADDLAALKASGMLDAVQGAWPDADVLLAELTLRYYQDGEAAKRLHDEVIAPARARAAIARSGWAARRWAAWARCCTTGPIPAMSMA